MYVALTSILVASSALAANADEPISTEKIPLAVLYVGNVEDPRGAEFEQFLSATFDLVDAIDRDTMSPEEGEGFDVVLLDWSQSDEDIMEMEKIRSPLGPRDEWQIPTVLFDSAGLLIAGDWELPGSWG